MKRKSEITNHVERKKQPQYVYFGTLFDDLAEQMESPNAAGPITAEEKQKTATSENHETT